MTNCADCISPQRIRSDETNGIQFYSTIALTTGVHKARDNEIVIRRTSAESNPIYPSSFAPGRKSRRTQMTVSPRHNKSNFAERRDVIFATTLIYSSSRVHETRSIPELPRCIRLNELVDDFLIEFQVKLSNKSVIYGLVRNTFSVERLRTCNDDLLRYLC